MDHEKSIQNEKYEELKKYCDEYIINQENLINQDQYIINEDNEITELKLDYEEKLKVILIYVKIMI